MKRVNRFVGLNFLFVILLAAAGVSGQRDYTFVGLDGSNPTTFFSNANWQCSPPDPACNIPGPDDIARIGRVTQGGYDVFSPRALGAVGVKQLFILNGSTLNFTNFTASQVFLLGDLPASAARLEAVSSGSIFNNNGMMTIPSQGASSIFAGSFNFINNGTVNSWNLFMVSGPMITNQPNASFFVHATNGFGIGGNGAFTFNNLGILSKPSSPGLAIISQVNLINSGSVEVGNGTLQIGNGSFITSNCGRFQSLTASAVLLIQAAMTVNPCPPLAPPGDVASNFFGPGPIRFQNNIFLNGGDFRVGFAHPVSGAITAGNVEFQSDSILGTGNIRIVGDAQNQSRFTWSSGQIGGSGGFFVDLGAVLNISPPSFGGVNINTRTFSNAGTVNWTGGAIGNSVTAFTFNNLPTGLFDIQNDSSFSSGTTPQSVYTNSGVVRKRLGTGTSTFSLNFTNTGIVDVQSGTLRFLATAPNNNRFSGNFDIAGGAFIEFGSGSGGYIFDPGFTSTGAGAIRIPGGVTATVNTPISISNLHLAGGTITGSATGTTINLTGLNSLFDGGISRNLRYAGEFAGTRIQIQGSNNFFNEGTTIDNRGDLIAPHNTSLRQNAGAAFHLNNFGNLFPGDPIGTIFMDGNFTQSPTGSLKIDIGGTTPGTQHDQLRVFAGTAAGTGVATVAGSLNVNFVNGFVPVHNQFFQIMTCQNGCNGQFTNITGVNVAPDRILIPGYGPNATSLITTQISGGINPPVLTRVRLVGGNTLISGTYTGAPNTTYLITLNTGCGATGQTNLQSRVVTTDSSGAAQYTVVLIFRALAIGTAVSARATDNNNMTSNPSNCLIVPPPYLTADFDGDRKTDLSIYRPTLGQWWFQESSDNAVAAVRVFTFGTATDKIVPGDYDGDSKTDIAVWRPASGEWFVLRSSNLTYSSAPFGLPTDTPAPADFDGDGLWDLGIYRPSQSTWYINKSSGGVDIVPWGLSTDVPQPADYDGDGKADIAIFRPSGGSGQAEWWVLKSTGGVLTTAFGSSTDKPVPADFTGDGKTDIAVWRQSNGEWFVLRSEDFSYYSVPFGLNGDRPVVGDYDGDGKADVAIFRPLQATWYVQRSTAGIMIQQFGLSTDMPVPSAYVP